MKKHLIKLKNVKVHNLKNICIEFPTQELIVFSGVSGSGKSSLAFDTIYTEGQRRYIESLSNYLKKQLGGLSKPDAESVEGITPTIAIEQKSVSKNPRSTVSTLTSIQDFLRIVFAKIAIPYCPVSQKPVRPQSLQEILKTIMSFEKGSRWIILAPFIRDKKGAFKEDLKDLEKSGYLKALIDGELKDLTETIELDKQTFHTIEIVIDRIVIEKENENRILESLQAALDYKDQTLTLYSPDNSEKHFFSTLAYSPDSKISYPPLEPQDFSFNHPQGMCSACEGLGMSYEFDLSKLIDGKKSLKEGCIAFQGDYETVKWGNIYNNLAKLYDFDVSAPFETLDDAAKHVILYGTKAKWTTMHFVHPVKKTRWIEYVQWKGIISDLKERYKEAGSELYRGVMEKMMHQALCSSCNGSRLKAYPSAAKLGNKTLFQIASLNLKDCLTFFETLKLSSFEKEIASGLIQEITQRLKFILEVGLDYLSLYRSSPTLSGGEAQRIRLASQIGSGLVGTTYVLDEPSIGLHPSDNVRLLATLKKLRDLGNTVLVVEHDEDTILNADRIIDVGPGAGSQGGEILVNGSLKDLLNCKRSLTAAFLRGESEIAVPKLRRSPNGFLSLKGATLHNLKNVSVDFPLGCLVAVTGMSGSGKSSLILGTLFPALSNLLQRSELDCGPYQELVGIEKVKKVIGIDQSPIGRTPRSNPATYVKIFDEIRNLFASTQDAKASGFTAGRFSFNVKEGSCQQCLGMGVIKMDMDFMEDEEVECPLCLGKRFDPQTLSILYKSKSIYDVLEMSIGEARVFFENIPHLESKLKLLETVGLGYMRLGQSSTTLSGGEAQRIKLAKELIRPSQGGTFYILDEPTTGLHFVDIHRLLGILNQLTSLGNTVVVIEHNMDLVKTADYVIDLGPKGGDEGGYILGCGMPEELSEMMSATSHALKCALKLNRKERTKKQLGIREKPTADKTQSDEIEILKAKQHNLKEVSLSIPREKITIFTGPSGSGKSSLAFDTIFAEGQRRYVESLPAYVRQFVEQMPKPQVEWIEGLSPAIAIDQGRVLKNPRSTIGTMTESYDYLRILFAKEGTPYCPDTGEEIKPISIPYVLNRLFSQFDEKKAIVLAPVKHAQTLDFPKFCNEMQKLGFLKVKINDTYYELSDSIPFNHKLKNAVKIVIDRLVIKKESKKRLFDAIETASTLGNNQLYVEIDEVEHYYHLAFAVESTGKSYSPITPKSFSFNAEDGMCLECHGLGFQYGASSWIQKNLSTYTPLEILYVFLKDFATKHVFKHFLKAFKALKIDPETPLGEMDEKTKTLFLKGSATDSSQFKWVGLENTIERISKVGNRFIKEFFHQTLQEVTCPSCKGSRLNPLASSVKLDNLTMKEFTELSVSDLLSKLKQLKVHHVELLTEVMDQLIKRLSFMENIGLSYLSLSRTAPTLSGGELQRIRLSKQLGASLSGCLYVLDEPTIGLHPYNNHLLNQALKDLVKLNNTVILVEHDPMTLKIADYMVDFGPKAGKDGGYILAKGSYDEICSNPSSLTGLYLSHQKRLPPIEKSTKKRGQLEFIGARINNLQDLNFTIPLGKMTCITGVSGSGKSTLLKEVIQKNLSAYVDTKKEEFFHIKRIAGLDQIEKVLVMSQGTVGQTNRADISTYTDLLTSLRTFFAALPQATTRGLQPKNFSFNHQKGMCQTCQGLGVKLIDLKFMSPIKVTCEDCHGFRLNPMSLKVTYKNKHLGEILNLSVVDALAFLPPIPKAEKILNSLISVGLGYLNLSQEIATLSGGEAQRLKLSKELTKQASQKTIFLLDEPTTGLHFEDLKILFKVFEKLLSKGSTLVIVEHNMDLIKEADHIIDLGPHAGKNGGKLVFEGNVDGLLNSKESLTGQFLKEHFFELVGS